MKACYFRLLEDMQIPRWLFGRIGAADGSYFDRWLFRNGVPVEPHTALQAEIVKAGTPVDFGINHHGALIVSPRTSEVFRHVAPDAIQVFPVRIGATGVIYDIVNITQCVDCLDFAKSYVERFQPNDPVRPDLAGEISLVINLHVDPERAGGKDLFRLSNYLGAVIISARLKEALEAARITGAAFKPATGPGAVELEIPPDRMGRRSPW
jgi:hypothetical protein